MNKLTPIKSIRKFCLWCYNAQTPHDSQAIQIPDCPSEKCFLYPFRLGKRPKGFHPIKSIRKRCLDCSGGILQEVKDCAFIDCSLFLYRLGHRPKN
jgi:hypothetical protein